MRKLFTLFLLFIIFMPLINITNANAYLLKELQALSASSYKLGFFMRGKNKNLAPAQSYRGCKALILQKLNPALSKKANNRVAKLIYDFSPADITYCFMGYIDTKPQIINSVTDMSYIAGQKIYKRNPNLSTAGSYVTCQNSVVVIDAGLLKMQDTNIYKQFLYYAHPAQDTYCWVGYLDAAGANK
jgi:hypothetical protein